MTQRITDVPGFRRQITWTIILSGAFFNLSNSLAWPTIIPKIKESDSDVDITEEDTPWLVTSTGLTAIFVPILTGTLMEWVGSVRLMRQCLVPTIALWLLMVLPSKTAIYVGRLGQGLTLGMIATITTPLVTEIVAPQIRGIASSVLKIQQSFGLLFMYVTVTFLHWQLATFLCVIPLVPVLILLLVLPESPLWLVKHGRAEDAMKALVFVRGPDSNVSTELEKIKDVIKKHPSVSIMDQLHLMKEASNYRPMLLVLSILLTSILGGQAALVQYTLLIFEKADVGMDPHICTILAGAVRLIASVLSLFIIDRVDRRPLLIQGCLACSICLLLSAVTMTLPWLPGWMTIFFILANVLSLGMAVGPVASLAMSEIIPAPIRSIGISLCMNVLTVVFLFTSISFPMMLERIGLAYSFVFFAASKVLLGFIYWKFVPETRGRSLLDMQNAFASFKENKQTKAE